MILREKARYRLFEYTIFESIYFIKKKSKILKLRVSTGEKR